MNKDQFAERVNAVIERHGLSRAEAARYFGVPVTTLNKWVIGSRAPSLATVRLLEVLCIVETFAPAIHDRLLER